MEQLLRQFSFVKKLQSFNVIREKLQKALCSWEENFDEIDARRDLLVFLLKTQTCKLLETSLKAHLHIQFPHA